MKDILDRYRPKNPAGNGPADVEDGEYRYRLLMKMRRSTSTVRTRSFSRSFYVSIGYEKQGCWTVYLLEDADDEHHLSGASLITGLSDP
jgi:hypothetical protein